MGTFSKIERDFWQDNFVAELIPEEKLFYLYILTNMHVNALGCYEFRFKGAVDDTGYNRETVIRLLERFLEAKKIMFDPETNEILILKWYKYNWSKKTSAARSILKDFREVQSPVLRAKLEELLIAYGIIKSKMVSTDGEEVDFEVTGNNGEHLGTTGNNEEHLGTTGNNGDKNFIEEEIEIEEEVEVEQKEKIKEKDNRKRSFSPPKLSEVEAYCHERGNAVNPERFVDFYSCKGWMVGKNKMKDWKAAVRTWEKQDAESVARNDLPQGASRKIPVMPQNDELERRRRMIGCGGNG